MADKCDGINSGGDRSKCKNGGTCYKVQRTTLFESDDGGFRCVCAPGWAGDTCTDKQGNYNPFFT